MAPTWGTGSVYRHLLVAGYTYIPVPGVRAVAAELIKMLCGMSFGDRWEKTHETIAGEQDIFPR